MKTSTSIILLFAVLLVAFVLIGFITQKESAQINTEIQNSPEATLPKIEDLDDTNSTAEQFGNDLDMELPIPDNDVPREQGIESAPVEVLEEVYGPGTANEPIVFSLEGKNYDFVMNGTEAPELRVNKGDKVNVILKSTGGFHDFVIDELGVSSTKVNLGETTSVTFEATKSGVYEYYCSVGSHRAQGMFGKFIVE